VSDLNSYYLTPCGECGNYYGHIRECGYWAMSGIAERVMFEEVNQRYQNEVFKLQKENIKLKEAMKAELKRCGGTVPILSECLEGIE